MKKIKGYTTFKTRDGYEKKEISGYEVIILDIKCIVHKNNNCWSVTELKTGLAMSTMNNTRKQAIVIAREKANKHKKTIHTVINNQLKTMGLKEKTQEEIKKEEYNTILNTSNNYHNDSINYMLAKQAGYID